MPISRAAWLLCLCAMAGCYSEQRPSSDVVGEQFEDGQINIGLMNVIASRQKPALLAERHINQAGGVLGTQINVIALSAPTMDIAVDKAIQMMDNYGIQAISVSTSSRTLLIAEESIPRQRLLLSESATSPAITALADDDLVFRFAPSDIYQGAVLAGIADELAAGTATIVFTEGDSYGAGLAAEFSQAFAATGGQILDTVQIPLEVSSGFSDYLARIYAGSPDVIVNVMIRASYGANLINESGVYQYQGHYLFGDSMVTAAFFNNIADLKLLGQATAVTPGRGLAGREEFDFFQQEYQRTFNETPDNFFSNAYDTIIALALAYEKAGRDHQNLAPTGPLLGDALRAVMNPPGTPVGPHQLEQALSLLKAGEDIHYQAAYSDVDLDANGDISGKLVYDVYRFSITGQSFLLDRQEVIDTNTMVTQ